MTAVIRPGRDDDAAAYVRLIGDAWREYPGIIFDVDAELPELHALAGWFHEAGGAVWIAEQDGDPVGMVGTKPLGADAAYEIGRMYVAQVARGTGLAHRLLATAEAHARDAGAERLVLWTDTRFEAAHAFYEKRGFVRQGAIRILDDLSRSLEFRYAKPLRGVVVDMLDAAAASSAERRLAEILRACVDHGAALGFRAPLSAERAGTHWKRVSASAASGATLLLAAWAEGVLAGAVMLDMDMAETQPHRADLRMLMVHPALRGQGIGRALLRRAEQAAERLGRPVLTAQAGRPDLFTALGWEIAGRIADDTRDAAGLARQTLIMRRVL